MPLPAERIQRYSTVFRPLPPPSVGPQGGNQVCVTFGEQWVPYVVGMLEAIRWADSWRTDDPATARQAVEWTAQLQNIFAHAEPCESGGQPGGNRDTVGGLLIDCCESEDCECQTEQDNEMPTVHFDNAGNLYLSVCGQLRPIAGATLSASGEFVGGTQPGDGGPQVNSPDNTSGGVITTEGGATSCDVVTQVVPYIASQMSEIAQDIQQAVNTGTNIADGIAGFGDIIPVSGDAAEEAVNLWNRILENGPDNIRSMLEDTDFVFRLQQEAFVVLNGRPRGFQLTRSDLRAIMRRMPIFWGNPLQDSYVPAASVVLQLFAELLNLEKINLRVFLSAGNGDANLCAYLASTRGLDYTPPNALPSGDAAATPVPIGSQYIAYELGDLGFLSTTGQQSSIGTYPNTIAVVFRFGETPGGTGPRQINFKTADADGGSTSAWGTQSLFSTDEYPEGALIALGDLGAVTTYLEQERASVTPDVSVGNAFGGLVQTEMFFDGTNNGRLIEVTQIAVITLVSS